MLDSKRSWPVAVVMENSMKDQPLTLHEPALHSSWMFRCSYYAGYCNSHWANVLHTCYEWCTYNALHDCTECCVELHWNVVTPPVYHLCMYMFIDALACIYVLRAWVSDNFLIMAPQFCDTCSRVLLMLLVCGWEMIGIGMWYCYQEHTKPHLTTNQGNGDVSKIFLCIP